MPAYFIRWGLEVRKHEVTLKILTPFFRILSSIVILLKAIVLERTSLRNQAKPEL